MITAQTRYQQLETARTPFLERAKECSKYTIPSVVPENDIYNGDPGKLITPFQSSGSAGVNNLASKLLLTLFPPDTPFFKLEGSNKVLKELDKLPEEERVLKAQGINEGFAKMEEKILADANTGSDRSTLSESLKHLIIAGNGLLFDSEKGLRFFPLSQYVVSRDASDNVMEIIVKERINPLMLDTEIQAQLKNPPKEDDSNNEQVEIYTYIKRTSENWIIFQEVEGKGIESTKGTYPLDACPWIVLRLIKISGCSYGRSYVEEYLGDLKSLEALSEALVVGAAVSAKVLFLVNPGGTTDEEDLQNAASGDFVPGTADDVTTLYVEKSRDFQTAMVDVQALKDALAHAFLQNSAIQRNGERVTAEEIRYVAGELEDVLGGIYALLSQELQLPYVKSKINKLMKSGDIVSVDPSLIQPHIVTGLDALGRRHDSNKILEFLSAVSQTLGAQIVPQYLNIPIIINELAITMGVSQKGIIKSQEQLAQEQQAAQQQQMQQMLMQQGTAPAINQMGNIATKSMEMAGNAQGGAPSNG